jgi:Cu2+-exporting ATPase
MRTVTIEVAGLLSPLSALGVQKQLARLAGVTKAEVNYVAGSATITYDETVIDLSSIKAKVHECGYHCAGEVLPKHVCVPDDPPGDALAIAPVHDHPYHAGHATPAAHGAEAMPREHAAPAE